MTEREDTIERIERVLKLTHEKSITVTIPRLTAERAVALLKEQEPVEPSKDNVRNRRCPKCFTILKGKFCHECGQAVKWE